MAAVVLGCGLGLDAPSLGLGLRPQAKDLVTLEGSFAGPEVSYLAKAGKTSTLTAVAGVDFAWPAIQA